MRVRFLTSLATFEGAAYAEGEEVELDDYEATRFAESGVVEVLIEEPVRKSGRAPRGGERAVKAPKGEQR